MKESKEKDLIKNSWSVYIVECSDGTYYCGISKDVHKRIAKHNAGSGSKYTRSRIPVRLVVYRKNLTKSQALSLECKVKKQPRDKKISFLLSCAV